MSKIHTKTGSKCIICDEPIIHFDGKKHCVIFHKSRRQTHSTCIDCAIGYLQPILTMMLNKIRLNIKNDISNIKCPGSFQGLLRNKCKCSRRLRQMDIPECSLSLDIFRITYILENNNTCLCPNEKCGNIFEIDAHYPNINLRCNYCNITWCRQCLTMPFHVGKSCIEVEIENNKSENGQYILDMKKQGILKFCPQCRSPCIKNDGCNKMQCSQCNVVWCWLCTKPDIDYDHYNTGLVGSCTGKLWEGVDINDGVPFPELIDF